MGEISDMLEKDPASVIADYKPTDEEGEEEEPKKEDEPKEEPKKEPKVEEPKAEEPKAEEPKEEPKAEEPKEEPAPPSRIEILSEVLGQDFEDEDEISEAVRSYKEKAESYQTVKQELDDLKAGIDPVELGFIANETEWKRQIALKQFPDYDPALITRVMKEGSEKLGDLEAIRLHRMLSDPDVYESTSDVDILLKKELGLEADESIVLDDLDRTQQLQLKKLGKDARKIFANVKDSVKLPEKVSLDEKQKEAEKSAKEFQNKNLPLWKRELKDVPKQLDSIQFSYVDPESKEEVKLFTYEIDASFREEVKKVMPQVAEMLSKTEHTSKAAKAEMDKIAKTLKDKYYNDNRDKIMFAYKNKLEKELADKEHKESHNPKEPNLTEKDTAEKAPQQKSKEKAEADILSRANYEQ